MSNNLELMIAQAVLDLKQLRAEHQELIEERDDFDVEDSFTEEAFEQFLNDTSDDIELFGNSYQSGTLLRKLDRIAFIQAYHQHCDSLNSTEMEDYQSIQDEIDDVEAEIEVTEEQVTALEKELKDQVKQAENN